MGAMSSSSALARALLALSSWPNSSPPSKKWRSSFSLTSACSKAQRGSKGRAFRREMELIARLKHPHIVRLIDSGTVGDSIYTVLEYVKGETLFDRLQQLGTFDAVEAGRVMFQALEALANAHAEGVIHRDFKPQNVMLVPGAYKTSAMVLDFGVAGILKEARGTDYISLTAETEIHGTPTYMAPEQLRRAPLTPQSDIYSWGLVFYRALAGNTRGAGRQQL